MQRNTLSHCASFGFMRPHGSVEKVGSDSIVCMAQVGRWMNDRVL